VPAVVEGAKGETHLKAEIAGGSPSRAEVVLFVHGYHSGFGLQR
jgi:hypothetical protein